MRTVTVSHNWYSFPRCLGVAVPTVFGVPSDVSCRDQGRTCRAWSGLVGMKAELGHSLTITLTGLYPSRTTQLDPGGRSLDLVIPLGSDLMDSALVLVWGVHDNTQMLTMLFLHPQTENKIKHMTGNN